MKDNTDLLKQVNIDIIFFSISLAISITSFYLINEKKKSILNIDCISNDNANNIYKVSRRVYVIVCIYFFLNAYNNYKNVTKEEDKKQAVLLLVATSFILVGSLFYLPLGNSNLIIEN